MTQWRIRVVVPEAGAGWHALRDVLAQTPVTDLRLDPAGTEATEMTGDVIVEPGNDEALGDLLRTLHEISPQVLVSRVGSAGPDQPIRVRRLRGRTLEQRPLGAPGAVCGDSQSEHPPHRRQLEYGIRLARPARRAQRPGI
jgi:hypothetical protein